MMIRRRYSPSSRGARRGAGMSPDVVVAEFITIAVGWGEYRKSPVCLKGARNGSTTIGRDVWSGETMAQEKQC
jgi:hypothetical protein